MHADLEKEVRKLAEFLEVSISDEKLRELCAFVHIDNMKRNPANQTRFDGEVTGMLRQGKAGTWKDALTVRESEVIDQLYGSQIQELGLPVIY